HRVLDRWESDVKAAGAPKADTPNLRKAIDIYFTDCRRRKLAADTIRNRRNTLDQFCDSVGPTRDITELTIDHVSDFNLQRSEAPGRKKEFTSTSTLRKEHEHVRTFCEFCVDREWIVKNPARKVRPPKEDSEPTLPFSDEEVQELISACDRID